MGIASPREGEVVLIDRQTIDMPRFSIIIKGVRLVVLLRKSSLPLVSGLISNAI